MTNQQWVLSFDGIDDYIEVKDPFENTTEFTISLWVKPSLINDGGWHGFIGKQGDQYRKPGLWLCPNNAGLHYDSYNLAGQRFGEQLDNFFEKDVWVHVAWVKQGTEYKFYRNGELFGTKPAPDTFYGAATSYWIGRVDNFWPGLIAEVGFWNRARSQEEIKGSMNTRLQGNEAGLVGYWALNEGSGNTVTDKIKGNNGTINGATWLQQELPVQPAPTPVTPQTLEDGLIAHYLFDSDAQDSSGHNLHGIVYGATLTTDRFGNPESAYQFDGVDDYIEVPHNDLLNLKNDFTISLWLKQEAGQTAGYRLVDKNTPGLSNGYIFDTYDGSTGRKLRLSAAGENIYSNTVYSLNEWHHVAVVFSKGVSTFYLDGQPDGGGKHPHTSVNSNTLTLRIATAHDSKVEFFKGALDDIRIYNRALSGAEIKGVHQLPYSKNPEPETTVTPQVEITQIVYKGQVKKTQSDEYVEITNQENKPVDISGWQIASGVGRNKFFTFPAGTTLAAGQKIRVYTNEVHPESGGFSCGSKLSLWKDTGDEARLLDAQGNWVSGLAYDSKGNFTRTKTANENTSATFESVKAELGVSNLKHDISDADIKAQTTPETKVNCVDAFRKALKSFIEDGTDERSAFAEVRDYPSFFDLPDGNNEAKVIREKVRETINNHCRIKLVSLNSQDPEDNEYSFWKDMVEGYAQTYNCSPNLNDSWIFMLTSDKFNNHNCAVVDQAGVKPTVNWGFLFG